MSRRPQSPRTPTEPAPDRDGWPRWGLALALVALAFVIYAPALRGPFLWDDGRAISDNPAFRAPSPLAAIWAGQGDPDYLPVKSTLLWLLYRWFGTTTWPYHVANVAVHALNAILLWQVLRRLAIPGAWFAGLVFLLHPTHVESVAWISECKNTLSLAFGLLATLAWPISSTWPTWASSHSAARRARWRGGDCPRRGRRPFAAAVAMVLVGYGASSFARARDYASEHALWGDTVRKNPGSWQARNRFGVALLGRGDVAGAAAQFEAAVRAKPDDSDGRNNLGLALVGLGRVEEGIVQYRESIRLDGGQFFAHANLGDALTKQEQHAEAVASYREALRREPRVAPLHFRLAMSLVELGDLDGAATSLRAADALVPHDPEIAAAFERLRQRRAALVDERADERE